MSETLPRVLLLGEIEHAKSSWGDLSSLAKLVIPEAKNRDDLIVACKNGEFDGVTAICDRAPFSFIYGSFNLELIDVMPASLRFICHNGRLVPDDSRPKSQSIFKKKRLKSLCGRKAPKRTQSFTKRGLESRVLYSNNVSGAGYDSIDVNACNKRSILVSNCPGVVEDSTADAGIFLMLAALRGFNNGILAIRNGQWDGVNPPSPQGHNPQGKILGILGMGGIGRNMKRKAECFGMEVVYHNRNRLSDDLADGAEYVTFDDLLARSDVLSLNLPLNSHTRNIISTQEFEKMKSGIVIVNTARGGVLDEDALVQALEAGRVRSVGLDVYQQEPNIHAGLVSNPHVCLLPHMGTFSVETKQLMEELTISNVRSALEHGRLQTVVPEQKEMMDRLTI